MKKSPFVLKNSNVTSQSVPNKKASNTTSTLNYLQILKQYNSCKIVKNENSSLQPTSRLKNSKDASSSQNPVIIAPSNLKFKVNINTCSTKNILKPSMPINTQNDEKINSQPLIHSSKIYNKYMVKVPNDNYLRSSKSKENESDESKTIPVPNIMDKGDKENVYFIADKNFAKRNNKLSSYGSERGSLNKEKYSSPKEQQKLKISSTSKDNFDNQYCFFHPDKKVFIFVLIF